jgi:hypothetical protein
VAAAKARAIGKAATKQDAIRAVPSRRPTELQTPPGHQAQALGILDEVIDEADCLEKRDVPALARTVGQWNESIVQQVAALRSVLGNTVQSPVVGFPDSNQLAANGQPVL